MDDGFMFSSLPNARGGFTTRAVLGQQITEADFDAAVAADTGLPPEQCAEVLTQYLRYMLTAAEDSQWSPSLYGLIGLFPTSGGSKPQPDEFRTADDINAGVRIAFVAGAIRAWQQRLTLASQGAAEKVTPQLIAVVSEVSYRADEYCSGHFIAIRGRHMKLDPNDMAQGVFFVLSDGTEIRAETFALITRLRVHVLVPDTVSGPVRVRVASFINGSVRSSIHPNALQQVQAPIPGRV